MQTDLLVAGHGGQGILVAARVLANAALLEGRKVTYMPAYGAEIRGGTVHATLIISDRRIGAPTVSRPSAAVIMNRPSLDRFEPLLKPGAILVYNSSIIDREPQRCDLRIVPVPASDIANEMGVTRAVTLVAVGRYAAAADWPTLDVLVAALAKVLPSDRHHLLEGNRRAMGRGMQHSIPSGEPAIKPGK